MQDIDTIDLSSIESFLESLEPKQAKEPKHKAKKKTKPESITEFDWQSLPDITLENLDQILNPERSVKSKRKSVYKSKRKKLITRPYTAPELRYTIRKGDRKLVSATYTGQPIGGEYVETTFVKHYRRATQVVLTASHVQSIIKRVHGDMYDFKRELEKELHRQLANSEMIEIGTRAIKGLNTETLGAIIERVDERAKVYIGGRA